MQELTFVGSDGDYVLLQGPDGAQFKILLDDELRAAARRENISERDAVLISPREIQMQVRSGILPEELVAKTGATLDYIQKFALPVLDELRHVVNRALSVRITMAGDRYSETTQVEFGEVIANRLAQMGVQEFSWSSRKGELTGWELHCSFGDNLATWSFDPRKLALAPENELAISLSNTQSLTDGPLPKLRPVTVSAAKPKVKEVKTEPVVEVTSPPVAPVVSVTPTPSEPEWVEPVKSTSITEDLGSTAEFEGVVPFGRTKPNTEESESVDDLANTADLLDALRKRRAQRERELNEAAAIAKEQDSAAEDLDLQEGDSTAPLTVVADEPLEEAEPDDSDASAKPKPKGRTAMPSWDEIVFGTRNDED